MGNLLAKGAVCTLLCIVAAASASAAVKPPSTSTTPKITSVSKISTAQYQTITIKGTGFGTYHAYTGDSNYISLLDLSTKPRGWEAGYAPDGDTVTLEIKSWTNTEIVIGGFKGKWNTEYFHLTKGDKEKISIWNWQTRKGPATVTVTVQ